MQPILDIGIITSIASVITAVGVIVAATKRGREWFNKPAIEAVQKYEGQLRSIKRGTLRTELLLLIADKNSPEKDVFAAYEAYEKLGGNFYIHEVFDRWRKQKTRSKQ